MEKHDIGDHGDACEHAYDPRHLKEIKGML
jgi:hypothetical protein